MVHGGTVGEGSTMYIKLIAYPRAVQWVKAVQCKQAVQLNRLKPWKLQLTCMDRGMHWFRNQFIIINQLTCMDRGMHWLIIM